MQSPDVPEFEIPIPDNEEERLIVLQQHQIMNTAQEPAFNRIIDLVKHYIDYPIIAITFIDKDTQFLKASCGLDMTLMPRKMSFCTHTIAANAPVIVADTHQDERFKRNPLVVGETNCRAYIGIPILVNDRRGQQVALGALCLLDQVVREAPSTEQLSVLKNFCDIISDTLSLRLQQRQAERADEVKTAFLANMSHEIRTPMNGIMGILALIEQTPLNAQQQNYIRHIKNSNEHLLNIVNDILDLSKVESGKMPFESIPVDLRQLCEQVYSGFLARAQDNQLNLVFDYPPAIPQYVKTDPVRVRQILINLVSNALKFTPKFGTITLKAAACCEDCQVKLQVIDTGVGIKPESQAVIFDAYNQADKFTHRIYGGTGLGLSVCKALAEGMGGTVQVASEQGEGSTFSLCLPLELSDEAAYRQWHQHHQADMTPHERLSAHILLAEDNELNAMVAVKSLLKYGYQVTRAKDGLEAVQLFETAPSRYQIILMDHQMPLMDGVEATKVLRQKFARLPPIIAVTAHAMHGDKEVYLKAGMQDYCTKPYKPEMLDQMIQRWLHAEQVGLSTAFADVPSMALSWPGVGGESDDEANHRVTTMTTHKANP